MSLWECEVCHFLYDESNGLEEEGILPGTPWESIDKDWMCPDCGVKKERFNKVTDPSS